MISKSRCLAIIYRSEEIEWKYIKMINAKKVYEYLMNSGVVSTLEGNPMASISGFSSLFNYKSGTMTFIVPENKFSSYIPSFDNKHISLIIADRKESYHPCFDSIIRVENPRQAFFLAVEGYFNKSENEETTGITSDPQIYRIRSYVSENARIGRNVRIGIGCIIEGDVDIGDNTEIHHNVVIRNRTRIGKNCKIYSGTIIGEDGFGFKTDFDGIRHMLKHYGGVMIEDNVLISDNCCIARGAIDDTIIKRGVKINTMTHIAHNNVVGENTLITVGTRILGSCSIGANSYIAAGYIHNQSYIGEGAILGLGAVVIKDVEPGKKVVGNPAKPIPKKISDEALNG